jgi:hypothetical protein
MPDRADFALAIARLYDDGKSKPVVFVSAGTFTRALIRSGAPIECVDEAIHVAAVCGFHENVDPFGAVPASAEERWRVVLPGVGHEGGVHGMNGIAIEPLIRGHRDPSYWSEWLGDVIAHRFRCDLFIVDGMAVNGSDDGDPTVSVTLNGRNRRVLGMNVPVVG